MVKFPSAEELLQKRAVCDFRVWAFYNSPDQLIERQGLSHGLLQNIAIVQTPAAIAARVASATAGRFDHSGSKWPGERQEKTQPIRPMWSSRS